jgi:formylaminopyrimidine deformylase
MDKTERQIVEEIDKRQDELIDYLSKLISFPSENEGIPNTGKETEIQDFLYEDFLKSDFDQVEKIAAEDQEHRPNVIGVLKGKGANTHSLMFNAHADVVPVKEVEKNKWDNDAYTATLKDGKVFGRGASDCKGGLAATIFAAKILKELKVDLESDLYVLSSVGEESQEGETIGAALTIDRGYKPSFAVIAEPSNTELHIESAGNFLFELKIKGKEAHTAARNQILFPQRFGIPSGNEVGVDAVAKAVPFIELMQRVEIENCHKWKTQTMNSGGYPIPLDNQGLGFFTITASKIEGGQYIGAVCGYVNIVFVVWYPNWVKEEDVAMDLKKKIMLLSETDEWLKANPPEFIYPTIQHWGPFKTDIAHAGVRLLGESLKEVQQDEPIYSSFRAVCDGTFLQHRGVTPVVFGPGGLNMSVHGPNEFVPVDELIRCAKTYALFAYRYCNKK